MKRRDYSKSVRYAGGTYRKAGESLWECSATVFGVRHRRWVRSVADARMWLESEADPDAGRPLTRAESDDARQAIRLLGGRMSLADAARSVMAAMADEERPLADALDEWLAEKEMSLRPVTLAGYRGDAERLGKAFPGATVSAVTRKGVAAFLASAKPSMRNRAISVLGSFFEWCAARGWTRANPVRGQAKARRDAPRRTVLTVGAAESLMRRLEELGDAGAVVYAALGLFAGLRPYEASRIAAECLRGDYAMVGADVAKTRSERTVPIRPNLRAWLDRWMPAEGLACGRVSRLGAAVIADAAPEGCARDILRHSFASYLYEMTGDAARAAAELGHTTTAMLFSHYRGLVPPGSGEEFFGIMPKP